MLIVKMIFLKLILLKELNYLSIYGDVNESLNLNVILRKLNIVFKI